MKLSYDQIKDITLGAAYVEQKDGKTVFHRFTKKEEELYKISDSGFFNKAFANSCVTLEFCTNSASLFIKSHIIPRSSRRFFSHDIFVNNILIGSLKGKFESDEEVSNGKTVDGEFCLGEENREKSIRIHLPWSCSSDIIELSIDDGATLSPVKKSKRIIFYGDSITQGYDAEYTSNSYASQIMLRIKAEARNKGIGGEIFRPELAKLINDGFEPDIITVAYGTNDWFAQISKELFECRANDFFDSLAKNYPNAKIFAIAPIWRADYQDFSLLGEFAEIKECFAKISKKHQNVVMIDGFDFVPHDRNFFSDKSLHPNDDGFSYYADKLANELAKYL